MISLTEIWANIPLYNDYQVSNLGRIKSYKNGNEVILKGYVANNGYLTVSLNNKKYSVHRLVADVFIHKIPEKNVVNHIDGNKLNNSVENLEWCTTGDNIRHAYKIGLMDNAIKKMKKKKIRAKLVGQFEKEKLLKVFLGSNEAELYCKEKGIKVNSRNIRQVCEGNRKRAGGYVWKYL